jgi:hypothetical protein
VGFGFAQKYQQQAQGDGNQRRVFDVLMFLVQHQQHPSSRVETLGLEVVERDEGIESAFPSEDDCGLLVGSAGILSYRTSTRATTMVVFLALSYL